MLKKLLLAAVATLAVSSAAHANDTPNPLHTQQSFENIYRQVVDNATKAGSHTQTTCWKGYCSTSLDVIYTSDNSYAIAFRTIFDNGSENREFCASKEIKSLDRRCWWSTGSVTDQHWDGNAWQTSQTLAKAFDDETADNAKGMGL